MRIWEGVSRTVIIYVLCIDLAGDFDNNDNDDGDDDDDDAFSNECIFDCF